VLWARGSRWCCLLSWLASKRLPGSGRSKSTLEPELFIKCADGLSQISHSACMLASWGSDVFRSQGGVEFPTGGYSPRAPRSFLGSADSVKIRSRRLKSGWKRTTGGAALRRTLRQRLRFGTSYAVTKDWSHDPKKEHRIY
jgi:hypothetical protein